MPWPPDPLKDKISEEPVLTHSSCLGCLKYQHYSKGSQQLRAGSPGPPHYLFWRVASRRWRHHLAHYPIQPPPCHTFGGLLGQSAVDSLHLLTKFIHNAWAHLIDNWVSILLMDIKAAFPSVVPEWLFHNMHMRGLLAEYINWYRTRLTRRSTTLEFDDFVQINHNGALLCPVSETRLWGELQNTNLVPSVRDWREEALGMKISTIQTKQTRENSVTQKPQITWSTWKVTAQVITANAPHSTTRVHKHSISTDAGGQYVGHGVEQGDGVICFG